MNDLTMTVAGWVATEPRHVVGPTGTQLTSFRMASTSRYLDRDKGEWVDGQTEWFTVRVFRGASITVKDSIERGQPVVVRYLSSQMRQLWSVVLGFEVGLVDPGLGHHDRWVWSATESLGVGVVGGGQGVLPVLVDRVGGGEVDRGRGVPRDRGGAVDVVVLVEEAGAELAGVGQGGERGRELGQVLQGLELCLGVRVVVADPGPGVGAGHTQVGQQRRHGLG